MTRRIQPVFLLLLGWVASCTHPDAAVDAPWFVEEAAVRGIDFRHQSSEAGSTDPKMLFPDIMGSGAALADLDGDGDLDAYLVQSGLLTAADTTVRKAAPANRLYFNDGKGHFLPATAPGDAADTGYGMGVTAGDYDNDGDVDLYVTNVGRNVLLRNDGSGHFVNVAGAAGVDHPGFGTASAFLDLDRDGDLDLYLVNYVDWDPSIEKECRFGNQRTYCLPTNYAAPGMDVLYRNNGDGTFTDVSEAAGINLAYGRHASNFRASRPGLGLVGADFNKDGLIDLFVANDLMADQLWMNLGDLHFEDQAPFWGSDLDENGVAKGGMGVAAADFDDDDDVDVLVVNANGQTDSFFRNETTYFVDVTSEVGLGTQSRR
jgi:enediyne biosynthesis protein E4